MGDDMPKFYITFGQSHAHAFNGKTLDRNCVGVIDAKDYEGARVFAFQMFGSRWAMMYEKIPDMEFFPRGLISLS